MLEKDVTSSSKRTSSICNSPLPALAPHILLCVIPEGPSVPLDWIGFRRLRGLQYDVRGGAAPACEQIANPNLSIANTKEGTENRFSPLPG